MGRIPDGPGAKTVRNPPVYLPNNLGRIPDGPGAKTVRNPPVSHITQRRGAEKTLDPAPTTRSSR